MNRLFLKIFLSLPFLLIVLTFTSAQALELLDNLAYTTYEISLNESLVITDDVELSQHNTFTVYLFDSLSISDNEIFVDDLVEWIYDDEFTIDDSFDDNFEDDVYDWIQLYDERQTSKVVYKK